MRRGVGVLLVLAACKRAEQPPAPAVAPPPPTIVVDAAPPPPSEVDLLYAVPAVVAVSSLVANPAIQPYDLVDQDLATAWNSRTGDLAGAWIAFRVPADARISALKLTVGFTATGPEGDYFTMNQRIKRVRISKLDKTKATPITEVDLDIDNRNLQTIPFVQPGGDYRVELVTLVPGSKPRWREAAISDFQVIGTAPSGAPNLTIKVGSLDGPEYEPPVVIDVQPVQSAASIEQYCKDNAYKSFRPGKTDHTAPPCGQVAEGAPVAWPSGWSTTFFHTSWGEYDADCTLALRIGSSLYMLENLGTSCGGASVFKWCDGRHSVTQLGPWTAITTMHYTSHDQNIFDSETEGADEQLRICSTTGGDLACSEPITIGRLTCVGWGSGEPGADGLELKTTATRLNVAIANNTLTLTLGQVDGPLDPDIKAGAGRWPIVRR
ncbi:MAG TPA: hypothetical protein VGM90_36610 [Kofleriaceae bacterium]|jgi:hypothetical protein